MLKGLGNLANLGSLVKQAQQMGTQLQGVREQLKGKHVTGTAGGGLIEIEANGFGEVHAVRIDPSLVERGDREMIEDLLPAAFNQVATRVRELHAEAIRSATDGVDFPGIGEMVEKMMGPGPPQP